MPKETLPSSTPGTENASRNILIAVVVCVIVGGLVYYFIQQQKEKDFYDTYEYDYSDSSTEIVEGDESIDSTTPGYKIFMGESLGFQMDYPSDWTIDTSSSYVAVSFMSPIDGEDVFTENMNYTTEDLTPYPGTTLDDYSEAALGQIATAMPEYVLVGQGRRMLGEYEAGYLLGNYPLAGYNIEVLSVFAIDNETVYIITYTGEVEKSAEYTDIIDTMLASFKLL